MWAAISDSQGIQCSSSSIATSGAPLWRWSRPTAWRRVMAVRRTDRMRHQRVYGIYADAVGAQEQQIANRMWQERT